MEVKKIYLDMDGVLADFDKGVWKLCGMKTLPQNGKRDPHHDDLMWEAIRKVDHFYDKLKLMPGAGTCSTRSGTSTATGARS